MSKEKEESKKMRDRMWVVKNDNYKEDSVEMKSWRKAAEVFNKSERTVEDVKNELKKIRSEKMDEK